VIWRRIAAAERYALAMEALGAGTWHWDRRSGVVDWDPALEALYGLPEGGFGRRFEDWVACIHPDDRPEVLATLEQTLRTGGPHSVVYRTVHPDGTECWIEGRGQVIRDEAGEVIGLVGACHDITDRHAAEEERARILAAERRARERQEFLGAASDLFVRSLDVDQTLHDLARLAVPKLGDWCVVDLRGGRDEGLVTVAHSDPAKVELAESVRERFGSVLPYPVADLPGDGYIPEITDEMLRAAVHDDEHFRMLRKFGFRSAIAVPLEARGHALGSFVIAHAESGRHHTEQDAALAREIGRRASIAIDNARLFAERSRVASVLQRALLPPALPDIAGMEIASHYDTADATDIGGDFYDVMGAGDEWMIVIGDVRGKGLEAASLTSLARHTVRAAALRNPDPAQILGVLNDALIEHDPMESFCTAICARLHLGPGQITVVLALGGHPAPLLLHPDGTLTTIEASGPLIGLLEDGEYPTTTVTMRPGDTLFLYTDGLTEARRGDELFGVERVEEALRVTAGLGADAAVRHVYEVVEDFQGRQRDDMALLALRLLP
jgi:PAS domain S-box-containing protein